VNQQRRPTGKGRLVLEQRREQEGTKRGRDARAGRAVARRTAEACGERAKSLVLMGCFE